jgi:hypothetical protein
MNTTNKDEPKVIMLRESLRDCIISDAITLGMAVSLTGFGRWMGSEALQWVGAIVFFLAMFAKANNWRNNSNKTPQQAADWLRDTFGVVATKREN